MIILASASPRRKEILESMGVKINIITADIDENSEKDSFDKIAMEIAEKKCRAVSQKIKGVSDIESLPIISADTVVFCDGEIMGKPKDRADAYRMIKKLSGHAHSVCTGICVGVGDRFECSASITKVFVDELSEAQIEAYIDSGEPFDKAGAYGIQGLFSKHIQKIDGCYFNVVGLPINELARLFNKTTGQDLF